MVLMEIMTENPLLAFSDFQSQLRFNFIYGLVRCENMILEFKLK